MAYLHIKEKINEPKENRKIILTELINFFFEHPPNGELLEKSDIDPNIFEHYCRLQLWNFGSDNPYDLFNNDGNQPVPWKSNCTKDEFAILFLFHVSLWATQNFQDPNYCLPIQLLACFFENAAEKLLNPPYASLFQQAMVCIISAGNINHPDLQLFLGLNAPPLIKRGEDLDINDYNIQLQCIEFLLDRLQFICIYNPENAEMDSYQEHEEEYCRVCHKTKGPQLQLHNVFNLNPDFNPTLTWNFAIAMQNYILNYDFESDDEILNIIHRLTWDQDNKLIDDRPNNTVFTFLLDKLRMPKNPDEAWKLHWIEYLDILVFFVESLFNEKPHDYKESSDSDKSSDSDDDNSPNEKKKALEIENELAQDLIRDEKKKRGPPSKVPRMQTSIPLIRKKWKLLHYTQPNRRFNILNQSQILEKLTALLMDFSTKPDLWPQNYDDGEGLQELMTYILKTTVGNCCSETTILYTVENIEKANLTQKTLLSEMINALQTDFHLLNFWNLKFNYQMNLFAQAGEIVDFLSNSGYYDSIKSTILTAHAPNSDLRRAIKNLSNVRNIHILLDQKKPNTKLEKSFLRFCKDYASLYAVFLDRRFYP